MQRLGFGHGSVNSALAKKAYEALDEAEPNASNVEELEALFHGVENESRQQQRKHKASLPRLCRCPYPSSL